LTQQNDVSAEMQQVSAYPTKQKMHQKDVALLEGQDFSNTPKQTQSAEDHRQT
jgi:hypothetical protein